MVFPVEILARGCPLCRSFSKIGPQLAETERGFLGCTNEKRQFFDKNLFKFYHKLISALKSERATKRCTILDAVTPLLHIDNWKKLAKNIKNGPPEVTGNVIPGVDVRAIQIKVHLSDVSNSVLQ